jgi:signal peptidase I
MKKRSLLLIIAVCLIIPLGVCAGVARFSVQPVRFEGKSMEPAISDGDRILMLKNFWTPQRGDIVVFKLPVDTAKSYVKRIIGLPGETVEIREGKVFINNQELKEEYLKPEFNQSRISQAPLTIKAKHYYVMGHNRDHSSDSRMWGTVAEDLIYGKFIGIY